MKERHAGCRRLPEAATAAPPPPLARPLAVLVAAVCLRAAGGTLPEEANSPNGTAVGSTVGLATNWQDNMPDPTGRHGLYSGGAGAGAGAVAAGAGTGGGGEAETARQTGSAAPGEESTGHISGIRDVEQCKDELELMTQRLRDRERSPLAAYWNGLSSWLHDNPYQIIISLVALTLGLVCAYVGPGEWHRLTSAGAAAAAAGVVCYEADAWELDRTSHILLLLPAAALGGGAAFKGEEGYQALLGAAVGFWTALSVAGPPEQTFAERPVPGLGAFWCSVGAMLGALALTVWRRRSLVALAPLVGGLLAASGFGVLVSRAQALLTGKAGPFLPEPDAPWSSAAAALLCPIGRGTFLGHFCSAALALGLRAVALREKRRRFAAIGLAAWAAVTAMAAALTLTCQSLGGKGEWCDFGPGPEGGGWSWTLCGLLLWAGISVPAGFRQFDLLDEELAASGDYVKVASIGCPPGQSSSGEFKTMAPTWRAGEAVEYYNEMKGTWVSTRVVAINPDGTYRLECRPDAPIDRIRPLPQDRSAVFGPGEVVGYFSASRKEWIPAKVLRRHPQGTYDLDCKPDVPPEKVRARSDSYRTGENVLYHASVEEGWVQARVVSANDNDEGTYCLDRHPDVPPSLMRKVDRAESFRVDRAEASERDALMTASPNGTLVTPLGSARHW